MHPPDIPQTVLIAVAQGDQAGQPPEVPRMVRPPVSKSDDSDT
jgi:hypothetical protein